MEAIENGIYYNTESSTRIASWQNHSDNGDFNWHAETLYKTSKGRWFLHGHGGPLSPYKERFHGGSKAGEAISVLTAKEAFEWLCQKGHVDEARAEFPEFIEEG